MKQTITLRVRFAETDAMGVVYHSRYFEFLEMARVALMDTAGLPYTTLNSSGYHLPVLELSAKYLRSAGFDDELTVTVEMLSMTGVRMELGYTIHKGKELIFEGRTLHAFVNDQGRPCRPPEQFAAQWQKMLAK